MNKADNREKQKRKAVLILSGGLDVQPFIACKERLMSHRSGITACRVHDSAIRHLVNERGFYGCKGISELAGTALSVCNAGKDANFVRSCQGSAIDYELQVYVAVDNKIRNGFACLRAIKNELVLQGHK